LFGNDTAGLDLTYLLFTKQGLAMANTHVYAGRFPAHRTCERFILLINDAALRDYSHCLCAEQDLEIATAHVDTGRITGAFYGWTVACDTTWIFGFNITSSAVYREDLACEAQRFF